MSFADLLINFTLKYGSYISMIIYLLLIWYIFQLNPYNIISNYHPASILISIILGYLLISTVNFLAKKNILYGYLAKDPSAWKWSLKPSLFLLMVLTIVCAIILSLMTITHLSTVIAFITSIIYYLIWALGISLACFVLYIIGKYALPKILPYLPSDLRKPINSLTQLLKRLFSIVILIPTLTKKLILHLSNAPLTFWIIIFAEIAIILLYVTWPFIKNFVKPLHNGIPLLQKPKYLNTNVTLNEDGMEKAINNGKNYSYSISADIWINPQPTSSSPAYTTDTQIFSIDNKLYVIYNAKENPRTFKVVAQTRGEMRELIAEPIIKFQKWNNLIVNYDHGNMDVFFNGKLINAKPSIIPYMYFGNITAGSENGIHGSIKDIIYFEQPLSYNRIRMLNLLK